MRHSMDRRRCCISCEYQADVTLPSTANPPANAVANLSAHFLQSGDSKSESSSDQKPLLGGRKFTEKLHECSNGRSGCVLGDDGVS